MFFLVDAFTDKPFLGNPAGVCLLEDVFEASSQELQEIAAYFNWSEIAFISKVSEDFFKIRWFSPRDEVPLCGHATLAAAHIVFAEGLTQKNKIEFSFADGSLFIERKDDLLIMSFPEKLMDLCDKPPFKVSDLFGEIPFKQVWKDDLLYLIEFENSEDVFNAVPNFCEIAKIEARALIITARGRGSSDCVSRYFAPRVGIFEDPVCGSAHCRLAPYWASKLGKKKLKAFQASKRTGILDLEVTDKPRVKILGKATIVAEFSSCPKIKCSCRDR